MHRQRGLGDPSTNRGIQIKPDEKGITPIDATIANFFVSTFVD